MTKLKGGIKLNTSMGFNRYTPLRGCDVIFILINPGETEKQAERRARLPTDFEGIVFFKEV